ncbi:extracellular solute-binding protein [Mesorhizobium sp. WSM4307]|uniref:extracellular solute-binding protein n=1 Tax=unclassified Mesorhizobium TaxID=325217 RepID=UPI000BAFC73F|nr:MULTISPECIES: extracellular solute-binding protein [unclassified Mesorhizobium]PBB24530.1 ABC transporter substrate-binding protein [Mesorhizobium sp. WSM4304]PBB74793.1 ABC transporter substrate-binding protein [Mesorhizobium sp. WSM4308]TRC71627.1 extracellular solute-binding protein [Mesorhizobium sp. WSM4315]TRC83431.1 extracellular solute-binding protein [Mesorhizobium sp. WSM4307]
MHQIKRVFAATAMLVAMAFPAVADNLVVYSPQGEENVQWITDQAKAAGHDVQFLRAPGGELFDRLIAEKNNPQADVVLGMVDTSMALLKKNGLFQAYSPAWAADLPAQYKDAEGIVHKFWSTPVIIAYDPDKLPEAQAPKSWLDLTREEYKGKYVIGNTAWQTTRIYLAGILARFLDDKGEVTQAGWDFLNAFYANAIVVGDADAQKEAFKSGGATINLNWLGGAMKMANELGTQVRVIDTEGGTPVISEGVAIMAGTDQLEQAKGFVDWFGSADVMAAYAKQFGQVPVLPAALAKSPAAVQANAKLVKAQPIDWDAIAPKLDGWLQKVELEIR